MTNEEVKILVELLMRESEHNREMAKRLIELNTVNIKRLIDVMVDRRLCKLDAAQEVLTGGEEPKFSEYPCQRDITGIERCATHKQSIWRCVEELTRRLG